MPTLSLRTVTIRAIDAAVQDRLSLAACYSEECSDRDDVLEQARKYRALAPRLKTASASLQDLSEDERLTVFGVLHDAAQWETSICESQQGKGSYARQARLTAELYTRFRLKHFGRSILEATLADSPSVPLADVVLRQAVQKPDSE